MKKYFDIQNNIFVSIPNFRDPLCISTIKSLYEHSRNPDRIYCGIFNQINNKNTYEQCYIEDFQYNTNIRSLTINYTEAKGPLWARIQIIKNLFQGEKYFLMIDAHTYFKKDWDLVLINSIETLKSKGISKPILSGYPSDINNKNEKGSYLLCDVVQGEDYPEVLKAVTKPDGNFYQSYFISANCMFTYGLFFKEINLDIIGKNLEYIFSGEELLFSLLAYLYSWDIFSIPFSVIFHQYKSTQDKINDKTEDWNKNIVEVKRKESYNQLKQLLTSNKLENEFTSRKTSDFYDIIKFNRNNKGIENKFTDSSRDYLCNKMRIINYQDS